MHLVHEYRIVVLVSALLLVVGYSEAKTISLNGDWQFVTDASRVFTIDSVRNVSGARIAHVPGSWQSQFADLRDYAGVAWYWRNLQIDRLATDQVAFLHFGAVDYITDVYVNGHKVGTHEGGFLPFEYDVSSLLHPGSNEVVLRVSDPGANPTVVERVSYPEIPHGKQNWYVQTSGPWQDVELRILPHVQLGTVHVSGNADGKFDISFQVNGGATAADLSIRDAAGSTVWTQKAKITGSPTRYSGTFANVKVWSPSSPALYTLTVRLASGDERTYRFGFRTFETRGGKFYLNGEVIYLRGALDQDFYPDSVYTTPSIDYLRDEMRKAKDLGLNMLRCHIKVPDPRYLDAADEIGLIVWYEIPTWDKLDDASKPRALQTMRGQVERDWNHPSIMIFSVINEGWSADMRSAADRKWLIDAWQQTKAAVPGWLVVDNTPCCENFHLKTDIADFHQYNAIPDDAASFDQEIAEQSQRASWLFSPYGDAKPRGDEPLVLSEFGNWGLPRPPQDKPWWFARDFRHNPMTLPDGVERRFERYGYGSLFTDINALAEATQWSEYRALKYEIEVLRMFPQMQGYVITEFTDINWESNGLLDMWRNPKVYARDLSNVQRDDVLVLRPEKRNLRAGETAKVSVYFSHFSQAPAQSWTLRWNLAGTNASGSLVVPELERGTGAKIADITLPIAAVDSPRKLVLEVTVDGSGRPTSSAKVPGPADSTVSNTTELFAYPAHTRAPAASYGIYDPSGRLDAFSKQLQSSGVRLASLAEPSTVWISTIFDQTVKQRLQQGGRVLVLTPEQQRLTSTIDIVNRTESNNLDGNWISSFLWVRKDHAPFIGIGFDTLVGFETQMVTPKQVIRGIPPEAFKDVLSGIFYGWVHSNVGTLLQARAGTGRLLVCTYNLAPQYGKDAYATTLLNQLLDYGASDFRVDYVLPLAEAARSAETD